MAKTSLARQLDLLKAPQTTQHRETRGAVSLLYDFFEAKSIDSNTHYSVALDGLEGLIKIDHKLARYKENLFHESSKTYDRSIQSVEANEQIDKLIEDYLFKVVSKYFQVMDTLKTLEWLIYRYKIHLFNVDAYIGSVLPYHETRQFARVLQTVSKIKDPKDTRWYWLKQIQMEGVPLSKAVLLAHCSSNFDFFRYIIDCVFKGMKIDEDNVLFGSYLISFCVNMLEHSKSEQVIAIVVSIISKTLRKNQPIFFSPACIILSHLSSIAQLEESVISKLLKLFPPRYFPDSKKSTFLALNIVCKTQEVAHFPVEFLSGPIMADMMEHVLSNDLSPLVQCILATLVQFSSEEKFDLEFFTEGTTRIIENKQMFDPIVIKALMPQINQLLESGDDNEKRQTFVKHLVDIFQRRFPLMFDASISELDSTERLSSLLDAFRYSQVEKYHVPLFVGLDHSSKKVRRASLMHLVKNFKNYITDTESKYLKSVLQTKFFENFDVTSVDILLEIFAVGEEIFNIFSPQEYEKIAFKIVHHCENNLAVKLQGTEEMEVDDDHVETSKWIELKKMLLTILFSRKFQDYYVDEIHFVVKSLFFSSQGRFRFVNFLFPSSDMQFESLEALVESPFGKSHQLFSKIKVLNTNFEDISVKNLEILAKFAAQNLDVVLDSGNFRRARSSLLEECSDSYRTSGVFLILTLAQVFQSSKEKERIGAAILDFLLFFMAHYSVGKISRKTEFEVFDENPEECLKNCLKQTSVYECSTIPCNILVYVLHKLCRDFDAKLTNAWSINGDGDKEALVYKLYKTLVFLSSSKNRDFSPSKHTFQVFQQLFGFFLKNIVLKQRDVMSFFWPLLVCETSKTLRIETLAILNSLFKVPSIVPRFIDSFSDERKTLIAHILALASDVQECRQLVVANLEHVLPLIDPKKDSAVFIRDLLVVKDSIVLDDRAVSMRLAAMHSSPEVSHKFVEQIVQDILGVFVEPVVPGQCRALMINLLLTFNNDIKERIFKFYSEKFGDFKSLNRSELDEMRALLGHFELDDCSLFDGDKKAKKPARNVRQQQVDSGFAEKFYLKAIEATEVSLPEDICRRLFRVFKTNFPRMQEKNNALALKIAKNLLELEIRLTETSTYNPNADCLKLVSSIKRNVSVVISYGKFTAALMQSLLSIEEVVQLYASLSKEGEAPSEKKKSKIDPTSFTSKVSHSWKILRMFVGFLQNTKEFNDSPVLMKALFDYFRLTFTEVGDVKKEHTRQIFLYAITHIVEVQLAAKSKAFDSTRGVEGAEGEDMQVDRVLDEKEMKDFLRQIDIQVIVDCISESRFKDTQKVALLSLSLLAPHFQEEILKSLVTIFTYIGTSLLQCDDQYSLAVLYETIESIIPMILTTAQAKADERRQYILTIFMNSFDDIPTHRRLMLFTKLISLLGEEKFMTVFTLKMFEKIQLTRDKVIKRQTQESFEALLPSVFKAFSLETQIHSLCTVLAVFDIKFFELIFNKVELKFDRTNAKVGDAAAIAKEMKLKLKSQEDKFVCGVNVLKFLSEFIADQEFRYQSNAVLASNEAQGIMELFTGLFHLIIELSVSLGSKDKDSLVHSQAIWFRHKTRNHLDTILLNFNQLLPATVMLDIVINKMLTNEYGVDKKMFVFIQLKALRLMYEKLTALDATVLDREKTLDIMEQLCQHLPASVAKVGEESGLLNVQYLMLAFKTCFKFFKDDKSMSDSEMELLTKFLNKIYDFTVSIQIEAPEKPVEEIQDKMRSNLKGSGLICIVHILCSMTTEGIQHLSKVVTFLLDNFDTTDEIILVSNVFAVSKIVNKFGQFLSPFMTKIILSLLRAFEIGEKEAGLRSRLQSTWATMAEVIPKRVLFPSIAESYEPATEISPKAVIELMQLFKNSCNEIDDAEVLSKSFRLLAVRSMLFRAKHIDTVDAKTIERVETACGEAISAFFIKLNEHQFRPLFFKLQTFALKTDNFEENEATGDTVMKDVGFYKMITFYRFCSQLGDTLKSLFPVFVAPSIMKSASEMLSAYHSQNTEEESEESELLKADSPKFKIDNESIGEPLIVAILSTLCKYFIYETNTVVTDDSISNIIKPLVAQISNTYGSDEDFKRRILLIVDCTQHLIQNNRDETLIKEFNYQILLKTREPSEKIRVAAIKVLHRLIVTCAEDYLSFIPETIPFISEMCEDHSDEVDSHLKKLIIEIEQLMGEPLKKYL